MLDKAIGMRHIRRWSALAWLAWSVHVPAFAAQVEMLPSYETVPSMVDYQACATCVLALSNKNARTIWALLAHDRSYDKGYVSVRPT